MTYEHYFIDPNAVLYKEMNEWNELLHDISNTWEEWLWYAIENKMDLVISNAVGGKFRVHAVRSGTELTREMYINITTLEDLKRVHFKATILGK